VTTKIDGKKFELLTKWYLRLNGYFTVDNFIIHAADDSQRISNGKVSNYTDIDVLGIRMPFHYEKTGELEIKNDMSLDCIEKIDIVIGECKTGEQNGLNKIWTKENFKAIEYLIRFCGVFKDNKSIEHVASTLIKQLAYEDDQYRLRTILFGQKEPNKEWLNKGLKFISANQIIDFLVGERGECWVKTNIGSESFHDSWDSQIKSIFKIANDQSKSKEKITNEVFEILK